MKVSVNWLKELVDIPHSVEELAHMLTMAGLEVEEIAPVAAAFNNVVIAEVITVAVHPNADKLRVCEVNVGTGTLLQIVCGAPNVTAGMRVPCALVGAKLPDLEIKNATLRGVQSNGMLCSARELGLSDEHSGLLVLANDAPIGHNIRAYLDLDDTYLTLKMTPNRGDCLSMIGVARDLAAITGAVLKVTAIPPSPSSESPFRAVGISAPNACGLYLGRVLEGVNASAITPAWMQRRLERAGFRSIAPLIDITNYVNLERGQPMHVFDHDKLTGAIDVRFARAGETIKLLNEQDVTLQPEMLLISDRLGPVAIAGVMGGHQSMATSTTSSIFFESAYFSPDVIQGKTRVIGINSDAAFRFERGVDPSGARDAIERATQLVLNICSLPETKVGPLSEAQGELPKHSATTVRPARVVRLLGMDISTTEMGAIFRRLRCNVSETGGLLLVTPPPHRFDLKIEEDFIEEIARINGYEKIPAEPPTATMTLSHVPERNRSRYASRHVMVDLGYQEVINYSFVPREWESDFADNVTPLSVANPISSQMSVMRTNLIGGLIASLRHNLNRGELRLKLFEMGRCFLRDTPTLDAQPEMLGGLAYGARYPEQWGEGGKKGAITDFFSIKGDLETLICGFEPRFEVCVHSAFHPGRSASVLISGQRAGSIGELHPKWQQKYDLPIAPIIFELDMALLENTRTPTYLSPSRMQTLRRDIAVLVDDAAEMQAMTDAIKVSKFASVIDFSPFDIYRGGNLGLGKKSVAFRILMQDTDRTLVDSEADKTVFEILEVLSKEFGATLRK